MKIFLYIPCPKLPITSGNLIFQVETEVLVLGDEYVFPQVILLILEGKAALDLS